MRYTLLFLCCVGHVPSGAGAGPAPALEWKARTSDLGALSRGQQARTQFTFTNRTPQPVSFSAVRTSCGCLDAQVDPAEVLPGATGTVSVRFDSRLFEGPVERSVVVLGSHSKTPETLLLTAQVQSEVQASPPLLLLGSMEKTYQGRHRIRLLPGPRGRGTPEKSLEKPRLLGNYPASLVTRALDDTGPVAIVGVRTSHPSITARLEGNHVEIAVHPGFPAGSVREKVLVLTSATYLKELVIPVVGEVESRVQWAPDYLEFGLLSAGQEASQRTVKVTSSVPHFRVTDAHVELDRAAADRGSWFAVSVQPVSRGQEVNIRLQFPSGVTLDSSENVAGTLVVKTTDEDHPEIRIRVFGILRKSG